MVVVPQYRDTASLRGRNQQSRQGEASNFGLYVGQGLAQLAKGISSVAEAVDYKDALTAEAEARNATNRYREVVRSGLYDPQTGYLNQTGGNALGERRAGTFETLSAARADIENSLPPRARRTFQEMADGLDNSAKDTAIRHEGVQFRDFTLQSFEASAQGFLDDALLGANDDRKFSAGLKAAELEIRNAAALQGTSPEATEAKVKQLYSTGHAGRVIEFARNDPVAAYEYLKAHEAEIDREQYDKLFSGLEPAYNASRARKWVSERNVQHGASGNADEDAYGVPFWLGASESGFNRNAANPNSSAKGVVQFVDDTYLKYVRKIAPAWAEGLSDAEVLATRSDRAKEGEVYRAFRADNQAALRTLGYEINPRNEYIMHHFGQGGGAALLNAEYNGQTNASLRDVLAANGINADKWIAANPWMEGKTVAGALNWFAGKTGGRTGANTVSNPTLMMQEALEIEDPKLRAAAIAELQLRATVAENTRNEERRLASEQAWDIIDNGGSPDSVPPELQSLVGVNTMNEIFNAYERNQQGVDFTDETRHLELLDLATKNPDAFASLDLNEDRANLSRGDLLALKTMQAEIAQDRKVLKEQGAAALVYTDEDYRKATNDADTQYQAAVGVTPGSKMSQEQTAQYNRFTQQLRAGMRSFANENGRQMTFEERTNFVNTLLAPVVIEGVNSGWLSGNSAFLFDVPGTARDGFEPAVTRDLVAPADERRITEELTTRYGRKPSTDEVIEQYENELLLSLGISPAIEYREIPKDMRRRLQDAYPQASDQEIVDLFIAITIEAAASSLQGDAASQ